MPKKKNAPVVAELGRPETAAEKQARTEKHSRLYRERKTVNNLIYSLLVSIAAVVVLVLMVPRGVDTFSSRSVDVESLAKEASASAGIELVAPEMPSDWLAKQAEVRHSRTDGITYWHIGYTTPGEQYAAVQQAFTADGSPVNETWIAGQLDGELATGTTDIGSLSWTEYDHSGKDPAESNMLYGLVSVTDQSTFLVYG